MRIKVVNQTNSYHFKIFNRVRCGSTMWLLLVVTWPNLTQSWAVKKKEKKTIHSIAVNVLICLTNVLGRSANVYRGALTAVNETEMKPLSIFIIDLFFLYICCALSKYHTREVMEYVSVPYHTDTIWLVLTALCGCDLHRCREYLALNGWMAYNSRWRRECVLDVTCVSVKSVRTQTSAVAVQMRWRKNANKILLCELYDVCNSRLH